MPPPQFGRVYRRSLARYSSPQIPQKQAIPAQIKVCVDQRALPYCFLASGLMTVWKLVSL